MIESQGKGDTQSYNKKKAGSFLISTSQLFLQNQTSDQRPHLKTHLSTCCGERILNQQANYDYEGLGGKKKVRDSFVSASLLCKRFTERANWLNK